MLDRGAGVRRRDGAGRRGPCQLAGTVLGTGPVSAGGTVLGTGPVFAGGIVRARRPRPDTAAAGGADGEADNLVLWVSTRGYQRGHHHMLTRRSENPPQTRCNKIVTSAAQPRPPPQRLCAVGIIEITGGTYK
ncbi:hypothetical protein GCM10017786_35670 [Amycolatopsis deserti]|uniref:Uncharacterized protein n=1 Tax=Amycolatopsis deserti TaxID=185696 RepID=A0ABQ3IZS8_9PSEU|nr:hypothetical protein GCM10017786_35670 [Amycolatopsis deserti]